VEGIDKDKAVEEIVNFRVGDRIRYRITVPAPRGGGERSVPRVIQGTATFTQYRWDDTGDLVVKMRTDYATKIEGRPLKGDLIELETEAEQATRTFALTPTANQIKSGRKA
jgi:hypothetical protein